MFCFIINLAPKIYKMKLHTTCILFIIHSNKLWVGRLLKNSLDYMIRLWDQWWVVLLHLDLERKLIAVFIWQSTLVKTHGVHLVYTPLPHVLISWHFFYSTFDSIQMFLSVSVLSKPYMVLYACHHPHAHKRSFHLCYNCFTQYFLCHCIAGWSFFILKNIDLKIVPFNLVTKMTLLDA